MERWKENYFPWNWLAAKQKQVESENSSNNFFFAYLHKTPRKQAWPDFTTAAITVAATDEKNAHVPVCDKQQKKINTVRNKRNIFTQNVSLSPSPKKKSEKKKIKLISVDWNSFVCVDSRNEKERKKRLSTKAWLSHCYMRPHTFDSFSSTLGVFRKIYYSLFQIFFGDRLLTKELLIIARISLLWLMLFFFRSPRRANLQLRI